MNDRIKKHIKYLESELAFVREKTRYEHNTDAAMYMLILDAIKDTLEALLEPEAKP